MKFLKMKKRVTSLRIGLLFDEALRSLLSFVPYFHSTFFSRKRVLVANHFIFFLYGGYGDAILTLELIHRIGRMGEIVIFVDKRLKNLEFLFPKKSIVVLYDKKTFIYDVKNLQGYVRKSSVFIQTSPIIELYLFKILLKIPYSIGLLSDFKYIRSIGVSTRPSRVHSNNRIEQFNNIYEKLKLLFANPQSDNELGYLHQSINKANGNFQEFGKYLILSAMKTSEWEMGRMPDLEYRLIAELLIKKYNFNVVFVGDAAEKGKIDAIISGSDFSSRMINKAGTTTLQELAILMRGAEFIVGNDNGITHLAAYLNVKTLVLFMFSSPDVYSWGNRKGYEYLFKPIKKCMPCVGIPSSPRDNYPIRCKQNLVCNNSITHIDIILKLERMGWV